MPRDGAEDEYHDGYAVLRVPAHRIRHRLARCLARLRAAGIGGEGGRRLWSRARTGATPYFGAIIRGVRFPVKALAYYRAAYRVVTSNSTAPAIVQCVDLDGLPIGVLLARKYRVPLVYDVQDLFADQHTVPAWYGRVMVAQERFLTRYVDRIIVANDEIGRVVADRHGVRVDGVVLNCPPLHPDHRSASPTIRGDLDLAEDRELVIYSGSLSPRRGLENTIRALAYLDKVTLVLLGDGPSRGALEDLAGRLRFDDRVVFRDSIPGSDVARYISSADVGIIPYEAASLNHYLCSPNKLFDYIQAGLPIVCSDFPFLRRIVVENDIGAVFDPRDPGSIANAARSVLDRPGGASEFRGRLAAIKRRYCWEHEARQFMDVYRSLTDPGR
jgi:glycosyltransferase involved in cell wall biosynthesis